MSEIVIADVEAYDPALAGAVTLRYATQGYTTGPGDTPANTFYAGYIKQPANVQRTCFSANATSGRSQIGFGALILVNNHGALDALLPYSFVGRPITIRMGEVLPNSGGVPSWTNVIKGTMEQAEFSWSSITLRVRDRQQDIAKPLQQVRYGGTNTAGAGIDGDVENIKGRPKPIVYGRVFNAPLVSVNSTKLIYQAHDGSALQSVDAVYDRGVALSAGATYADQSTMESTPPAGGQYRTWNSAAGTYIRLGSTPAGTVTADLTQGATAAARTVGQVFNAVLLKAGVSAGDIEAADITALDVLCAFEVGVYVNPARDQTAIEVLDLVCASIGAWFGSDAQGKFRIGYLELPSGGTSVGSITATDVLAIDIVSARDPGVGVPVWKVKLGYQRIWEVQADLAATAGAARAAYAGLEYRRVEATDGAVLTANPSSPEIEFLTLLTSASDAATEAARRLDLYKVARDMLEVRVRVDIALAAVLDIGKVITLTLPRYALTAGKKFLIIGLRTDMRGRLFDLTLWG